MEKDELRFVKKMMKKDKYTVEEQIAKFIMKFGKSRNTYFLRKRKLLNNGVD